MKRRFLLLLSVSYLCLFLPACNNQTQPKKSTPVDFTGFWKQRCSDAWGVQIKKQAENLFSVSFCGPGGCFEPGTWMPNTSITGDPKYRSINPTTLAIQHGEGWQTVTKCTLDINPILKQSPPTESSTTKQRGVETAMGAESYSYSYVKRPAPTLPFFDWNACPFEGCRYGRWTALATVTVFDSWKPSRKRILVLPTKAEVRGVSGVVITYRPGIIRLNKDLLQAKLRRGDTVLTYTNRGEGLSTVWFKRRFYREFDITFTKWPDGSGCLGTDCAGTYVDLGEKIWWAKVKTKSGLVGWVNMNEAEFAGIDQLAVAAPNFLLFTHKHSS